MHSVRVRIIQIGDAERLPEVDLPAINWFDPEAAAAPSAVDLAPGQIRRFQFVVQLVEKAATFGIRFGRVAGFIKGGNDEPFPVTIAAFSANASAMAEFEILPGSNGLSKVIAKRGVSKP